MGQAGRESTEACQAVEAVEVLRCHSAGPMSPSIGVSQEAALLSTVARLNPLRPGSCSPRPLGGMLEPVNQLMDKAATEKGQRGRQGGGKRVTSDFAGESTCQKAGSVA